MRNSFSAKHLQNVCNSFIKKEPKATGSFHGNDRLDLSWKFIIECKDEKDFKIKEKILVREATSLKTNNVIVGNSIMAQSTEPDDAWNIREQITKLKVRLPNYTDKIEEARLNYPKNSSGNWVIETIDSHDNKFPIQHGGW